jgi:hypothetical protein
MARVELRRQRASASAATPGDCALAAAAQRHCNEQGATRKGKARSAAQRDTEATREQTAEAA